MNPPLKQIAALPVVETADGPLVLLITTRARGRWTIPRGWPKPGVPDAQLAAREAFEEAGVEGEIGADPVIATSSRSRPSASFTLLTTSLRASLRATGMYSSPPRASCFSKALRSVDIAHAASFALMPVAWPMRARSADSNFSHTRGTPRNTVGRTSTR